MRLFRYAALALLVTAAAPAMAQSLLDYAPAGSPSEASDSFVLADSIFYDSGDNVTQFTIGFGFPNGSASPCDPGECRAIRYTTRVIYTVPVSRTTPFALTHLRIRYRTQTVSGPTSSPPRVLYASEDMPVVDVFDNAAPPPEDDSLLVQGQLATARLPLTTAVGPPSQVDQYQAPIVETRRVSFIPAGQTTVPANLVFQPGEKFSIRVQYFNVPFPAGVEAGSNAAANADSTSSSAQVGFAFNSALDLLGYGGFDMPDTTTPDGILDQWFMRAIYDNAFMIVAGEEGAAQRAVVLGTPSPNPAQGMVDLPFALLQDGRARITVYDVTGRQVAVAADRTFGSGGQVAEFDASRLAAGVYVIVLEAGGQRATQRLSVVR